MTFTTPNGIRYPNDPNAYADIIEFFKEMAEDVDTKFVSNKAAAATMAGTLTAKNYVSSNGGLSQASTVLQTGSAAASAFTVYDDNQKVDGTPGRRLWISGANGADVAIRTRSGSESLNRISLAATTIDLNSAVTINGTLSVTGTKTQQFNYESTVTLAASTPSWTAVPGAAGFTFTSPPSAAVTIGLGAMLPTSSTTCQITYRVRLGATLGQGTVIMDVNPPSWPYATEPPPHSVAANGSSSSGVQYFSVYTPYLLTSGTNQSQKVALVKNTAYNVVPYYYNANTVTLKLNRFYFTVIPDF